MPIRVKVINKDINYQPPKPEEEAKILTSDYVREVNLGIAARIIQREMSHRPDDSITRKLVRK